MSNAGRRGHVALAHLDSGDIFVGNDEGSQVWLRKITVISQALLLPHAVGGLLGLIKQPGLLHDFITSPALQKSRLLSAHRLSSLPQQPSAPSGRPCTPPPAASYCTASTVHCLQHMTGEGNPLPAGQMTWECWLAQLEWSRQRQLAALGEEIGGPGGRDLQCERNNGGMPGSINRFKPASSHAMRGGLATSYIHCSVR